MPLPVGVQTVRVFGTYLKPDGLPQKGFVKFVPAVTTQGSGVTVPNGETKAHLDRAGAFSVLLPTSTNTGLNPDGWTYRISEVFLDGAFRNYNAIVPASPADQDITSLTQTEVVVPTSLYALRTQLAYEHIQATPDVIWVVMHDLGYKPNVTCYNTDEEIIPGRPNHEDLNTMTISFDVAVAGSATCS